MVLMHLAARKVFLLSFLLNSLGEGVAVTSRKEGEWGMSNVFGGGVKVWSVNLIRPFPRSNLSFKGSMADAV